MMRTILLAGSLLAAGFVAFAAPVAAQQCPSSGLFVGDCDDEAPDTDCISYWGVFYGGNHVGYELDRDWTSSPSDPDGWCTGDSSFCFGANGDYPVCYRP